MNTAFGIYGMVGEREVSNVFGLGKIKNVKL
jgi:hypothetical protein